MAEAIKLTDEQQRVFDALSQSPPSSLLDDGLIVTTGMYLVILDGRLAVYWPSNHPNNKHRLSSACDEIKRHYHGPCDIPWPAQPHVGELTIAREHHEIIRMLPNVKYGPVVKPISRITPFTFDGGLGLVMERKASNG